jgi:uncharacterized protein with GYD domain
VESTHANESRCNEVALESNRQTEPLVTVPQLLKRSHDNNVSTRNRLARTGADARIEESAAMGEVRLALRPYGRKFKLVSRCLGVIQISSIISHPEDAKMVRLDLKFHTSGSRTHHLSSLTAGVLSQLSAHQSKIPHRSSPAAGFPLGLDITPILDRHLKTQLEIPMLSPRPVVPAFPGDVNG